MEFFDSHAHYNDEQFENDKEQVIKEIYKEGITKIINAGYSLESSRKAVEIANNHDFIYATCGISPNDITEDYENQFNEIIELAKNKKVVAIGEIGMDYHWNKENKDLQEKVFIRQIEIANNLDLPIVIHTREAVQDTIDILKNKVQAKNKGIFHCCPLNEYLVIEALKMEFYISFSGSITYKNSKNAEEIINMVPLEKILIETDSPYLSPEPLRGTRNDSRNVKLIAEKIAQVKGKTLEEIAQITYNNAGKFIKTK